MTFFCGKKKHFYQWTLTFCLSVDIIYFPPLSVDTSIFGHLSVDDKPHLPPHTKACLDILMIEKALTLL